MVQRTDVPGPTVVVLDPKYNGGPFGAYYDEKLKFYGLAPELEGMPFGKILDELRQPTAGTPVTRVQDSSYVVVSKNLGTVTLVVNKGTVTQSTIVPPSGSTETRTSTTSYSYGLDARAHEIIAMAVAKTK